MPSRDEAGKDLELKAEIQAPLHLFRGASVKWYPLEVHIMMINGA